MNKIPTLFKRDWSKRHAPITHQINPECLWVANGEGVATQKLDGTCCLVRCGVLFKRRELRDGDKIPINFQKICQDKETGKIIGWVPVEKGPEDKYHRKAYNKPLEDGTYELIGPKINTNLEKSPNYILIPHGKIIIPDCPRTFDGLFNFLAGKDIEGIVFHHPDGRMAKIKQRDFGLIRPK